MTTYTAFNGSETDRQDIIDQMYWHHKEDEIIQGRYWGGGKGCFIGCITHNSHADNGKIAASLLGWSPALVRAAEEVFETLPAAMAKDFALDLVTAAKAGADVTNVEWEFAYAVLAYVAGHVDGYTNRALAPALEILYMKIIGAPIRHNDIARAADALRAANKEGVYSPALLAGFAMVRATEPNATSPYEIATGIYHIYRLGDLIPDCHQMMYTSLVGLLQGSK